MPRIRPIYQLMASSILAIDEVGLQRIVANAVASTDDRGQATMAAFAQASNTGDEANERWREFLISTGRYPYWVNPDGRVLHSLDPEAKSYIQQGAIAVIPVKGILVKEAWTLEELWYGLVSSERITQFINSVAADDRVVGAVATVDSPGGMVSGTEKLGNAWMQLGASKRTVAHVDALAASAAYWFASGSGSIQMDCRTAYTGSIGVMTSFWDFTPVWEAIGAKYYEIYAPESEKKNEEFRKLRADNDPGGYQLRLSNIAKLFREHVLAGRGSKLQPSEPEALQGRVYAGDASVAVGLADGFNDLDGCIKLVRAATPTEDAPAAASPDQNIPPAEKDREDAEANNQPKPMKLKAMLAALAAALFSEKEEATQEVIEAANAELAEKGISNVAFVSTAEQQRLADASAALQEAEAAKTKAEQEKAEADAAKAAAETARTEAVAAKDKAEGAATATETKLKAAAEKHGIQVAEGGSLLDAVIAALGTTTEELTAAKAEIATLKNEAAPIAGAASPVNTTGDDKGHEANGLDNWLKD